MLKEVSVRINFVLPRKTSRSSKIWLQSSLFSFPFSESVVIFRVINWCCSVDVGWFYGLL